MEFCDLSLLLPLPSMNAIYLQYICNLSLIKLSSTAALEYEIKQMAILFEQRETEDNWTKFEDALLRLTAIARGSHSLPGFATLIKARLKTALIGCLSTERTRLARTAMMMVEVFGALLKERFEVLADTLMPAVLKLTARANRVYISSASATLKSCIESCGLVSFIPVLAEALKNASKTMRIAAMECICSIIAVNSIETLTHSIVSLELVLREGIVDSTNEVRNLSRSMFETYRNRFPDRVNRFVDDLPDIARKYIKIDKSRPTKLNGRIRANSKIVNSDTGYSPDDAALQSISSLSSSMSVSTPDFGQMEMMNTHASKSTSSIPNLYSYTAPTPTFGGPRRVLGEPSRVASTGIDHPSSDQPRPSQGRMTHLTEHLGGAQRVIRQEKPPSSSMPTIDFVAVVKQKPMRIPPAPTITRPSIRPTSLHSDLSRPASQASVHSVQSTRSLSSKPSGESIGGLSDSSYQQRPTSSSSRAIHPQGVYQNSTNSHRKTGSMTSLSAASSHNLSSRIEHNGSAPSLVSIRSVDGSRTSQNTLNLNKLKSDMKSSDWALRFSALQAIVAHATALKEKNEPCIDLNLKSGEKLLDMVLQGASDAHYRVMHTALQAILLFLEYTEFPKSSLGQVVAKVTSIYFSPSLKSKMGVGETSADILLLLKETFPGSVLCEAVMQALNNPEYAVNLKIRTGCIGFLSELTLAHWEDFLVKPGNFKLIMNRLVLFSVETDVVIQRSLKSVFQVLCELGGDAFWSAIKMLRQTDKKAINSLFGVDIEYDRTALINSEKLGRPGSPAAIHIKVAASPYAGVSPKISVKKPNSYISPSKSTFFKSSEDLLNDVEGVQHNAKLNKAPRTQSMIEYTDIQEHEGWLHADNIIPSASLTTPRKNTPCAEELDSHGTPLREFYECEGTLSASHATLQQESSRAPSPSVCPTEIHTLLDSSTLSDVGRASPDVLPLPPIHVHKRLDMNEGQATLGVETISITNRLSPTPSTNLHTVGYDMETITPALLHDALLSEESLLGDFQFLMPANSNRVPSALEALVRMSRKQCISLWQSCTYDVLQTILSSMSNTDRSAVVIKNALIILRELISNQAEFVVEHATSILIHVVRCEADSACFIKDFLDISSEVDAVLYAFEANMPRKQLLESGISLLHTDVDKRFSFEMLARLIVEMDDGDEMTNLSLDDILMTQLAQGLSSKKSATRKAAFDCAYTIRNRCGSEWSDRLYDAIRVTAGIPRQIVVRSMMEKKFISGCNEE
ncbi:hypothetical protein BASA50_011386 [Batrachochytrium salamandrivorans]|uniref:TOG domain-containing protein n=1 Tax=Batrachochytrium salamandrivorans TaxID=1357716 RepID=A0ABQ8EYY5_9FUNG|nr:hypothetical protein BASA50_011386 [Batrachochytrium salamandrivorans]